MTWALLLCLAAQPAPPKAAMLAAEGSRLLEAGNASAARAAFEESLKLDPARFEALHGLGFLGYAEERFDAAKGLLEKAVTVKPGSFQARFLLGAVSVRLGDNVAAIEHLRRAHSIDPSHLDARKLLAARYAAAGRHREAAALLRPLEAAGDEESALLALEARQGAGDSAGALALARQAASRFPKSARIAAWLGFQMQFAGRFDEAKPLFARAIELDSAFGEPCRLLGEVLLKEENHAEARGWFEKALALMPGDTETALGLAAALAGLGDPAKAVEVLAQAAPARDARVHLQLSRLYFRLGDRERARQQAQLSVQLRAENEKGRPLRPPSGVR